MNNDTRIFVNLPVKDLNKSIDFFTELGYKFNPQFTDRNATCMIVNENIFVMLVVEEFFKTFTKKVISDASRSTEVILALSAQNRGEVDELVDKAFAAGAKIANDPYDHGWMYGRSFHDPDSHLREIFYMDSAKAG